MIVEDAVVQLGTIAVGDTFLLPQPEENAVYELCLDEQGGGPAGHVPVVNLVTGHIAWKEPIAPIIKKAFKAVPIGAPLQQPLLAAAAAKPVQPTAGKK